MSIQLRVVDRNVQRCYGCECSNVHKYFVKIVGTEFSRGMHAALCAHKPLFPKREENTLTAKICKVKI